MKRKKQPITVAFKNDYRIEEYLKDRQADSFYRVYRLKDDFQIATVYNKDCVDKIVS